MKLKFKECQHSSHGTCTLYVHAIKQMILYTHPGKKNADSKTLVFHNSPPTTEKSEKKCNAWHKLQAVPTRVFSLQQQQTNNLASKRQKPSCP